MPAPIIAQLIDTAEQTVDELEQAAFVASLAPGGHRSKISRSARGISRRAVHGTEAAASGIRRRQPKWLRVGRADVDDAVRSHPVA